MSTNSQSHQAKLLGDLSSIGLTEIFETLGTKNRYGWLTLKNEKEVVLYFQGDLVGLVTLPEEKLSYIPEKLFYSNKISAEQYQLIIESEDPLSTLEESVDSDIILSFLNTIYYDEICYLFSWTEGYFEFVDQKPTDQATPIGKLFETETVLLDASRRLDENQEVIELFPDIHEIFLQDINLSVEVNKTSEPLGNVWSLANYKSFQEIISFSYLSEFDSSKILATLFKEKKIRLLEDEELYVHAKSLEQDKNILDIEKCYRILLRRDPYNIEACQALIHLHELENNSDILEELYEQIASNFLSSKDSHFYIQGAYYLKKYIDIKKTSPEGMEASLHLLNMIVHENLDPSSIEYEPVSNAKMLFQYFRTQRKDEKAKEVLENLLTLTPNDISIRSELINVYLDLGNKDKALEEYDFIISFHEKSKNNIELISIYKKIIRLEPHRKDIQQKLDKLAFKQKHKKNLISKILLIIILLGSFVGGGYYIQYAMEKKQEEKKDAIYQVERLIKNDLLIDAEEYVKRAASFDQLDKERFLKKIKDREEVLVTKIKKGLSRVSFKQENGDLLQAQEILKKIKKIKIHLDSEMTIKIRSLSFEISRKFKNFTLDMELAQKFEKKKSFDRAIVIYKKIWDNPGYVKYPKRNTIKYPIRVKNLTKEIKVFVDGKKIYAKNKILYVSPDFDKIQFKVNGYRAYAVYNAFGGQKRYIPRTSKEIIHPLKKSNFTIKFKKAKLWSYKIGGIIEAAPTFGDQKLYIATRDDNIYTLKSLNSNAIESWQPYKPNVLTSFNSSPIFWKGVLYLAGNNNKIYAIKEKYIQAKYSLRKNSLISAPAIFSKTNNLVFFLTENGQIYAMPLSKGIKSWFPRWTIQLPSPRKIIAGIDEEFLFVYSKSGYLYCIDQKNGQKKWQTRVSRRANSRPQVYNSTVYLGGNGMLYAFDKKSGKKIWETPVKGRVAGQPAVNSKGVFFGTSAFLVYGLDHKGNLKWRTKKGDEFQHSAILNKKNILYIACKNGTVYALNTRTGKTIWQYAIRKKTKTEQKITSPITLQNNKIFVGAYKEIYAFTDN